MLGYLGPRKIFYSDNGREFVNYVYIMQCLTEMKIAIMKQDEGHTGLKYPRMGFCIRRTHRSQIPSHGFLYSKA